LNAAIPFFNVDAERLLFENAKGEPAGYHRDAENTEERGGKLINPCPMTAVAPLGETPSLLASPLLPKGEANAKGEDRTASPMPNSQFPIPNLLKVLLRLAIQG
jgi:hypothetical protein